MTTVTDLRPPTFAPQRTAFVENIMGLPVSVHLRGYGLDRIEVRSGVADAFDALRHFDAVFSTYRPESDISRLARGEVGIDECDPLVSHCLDLSVDAARLTGGAFTPFLPDPDGCAELRFDPTGLVKGWAVDVAAEALEAMDGISFCINAGGDVLVGGCEAFGDWRVGIEDPDDRSRVARVVSLTRGAVATSGCAARGAHLYDPVAGQHVLRRGSRTVVADSLQCADLWATALFVGGDEAGERLRDAVPGAWTFTL